MKEVKAGISGIPSLQNIQVLSLSEPWFISLACQPEDFLILFSVFSKVTMCYIKSPCTRIFLEF